MKKFSRLRRLTALGAALTLAAGMALPAAAEDGGARPAFSDTAGTWCEEEIAAADASDSIHEEKFKAVKAFQVGHSLPEYLL